MPEGFDVRPEQLRRGAADLRADADGLDEAALAVGGGLDDVSVAAGPGPLAGSASELSTQLGRALQAIRANLMDCSDALEASSAQYLTADGHAGAGLEGPH